MGLQRVRHDLVTKEQQNHPHNQGAELIEVVTTRISLVLPLDIHTATTHFPHYQPLATKMLFSTHIVLLFQEYYINKFISYVIFQDCFFFSFSIIFLRSLQVVTSINNLLLFIAEHLSLQFIPRVFIHSPVDDIWSFLVWNSNEERCYEHSCPLVADICVHFSWVKTQEWNGGSQGKCMFQFIRNYQSSKVVVPFYTFTKSVQHCQGLHTLIYIWYGESF